MKKTSKKLLAILIIIVIMLGMVSFSTTAADYPVEILRSNNVAQNQTLIQNAIARAGSGDTVIVTSDGIITAAGALSFNIPNGVIVVWKANYTGTASPLIDLTGNGTFDVSTGGVISNTSTSSYTALRANASDSGAGIDIIVSDGAVQASLGTAIEGAGASTTVTVTGNGIVSNSATNNLRPVINMTNAAGTGQNVTVEDDGEVSAKATSTGAYGYSIQTYGEVLVSGGVVSTLGYYGRGINLVGINSVATVTGGTVYAAGASGVAISTATTPGVVVTNASVVIDGGLVYATTGMAIRTTGIKSSVTITDGLVIAYGTTIAGNNNVVFTQNNAAAGFTANSVTGTGMVIAWSGAAKDMEYEKGSFANIVFMPAGVSSITAVWDNHPPGNDGIRYANGINSGFIGFGDDLEYFYPVNVVTTGAPPATYTITSYSPPVPTTPGFTNGSGTVQPASVTVSEGDNVTFTFTPDPNNYVYDVDWYIVGNPVTSAKSLGPVSSWTFPEVSDNLVVRVFFARAAAGGNTILTFAGDGGNISGARITSNPCLIPVNIGAPPPVDIEIVAKPGYIISDVILNTNSIRDSLLATGTRDEFGNLTRCAYSFTTVSSNQVITATFQEINRITVTHNTGGIVTMGEATADVQGTVMVHQGDDVTFTIKPNTGFGIGGVLVDKAARAVASANPFVQFPSVSADHSIVVEFVQLSDRDDDEQSGLVTEPPWNDGDVSHLLETKVHIQFIRGVGNNIFQPGRDMTRAEVAQVFYNLLIEQNVPITKRFPDEPTSAWHEKAVHTLASLGIIQGYKDGSFRPEDSVTRAEFIVMAARFVKSLPGAVHLPFTDVPEKHWAYEQINSAVQFGWTNGYGDGSFRPSRHISRAEAVIIVNRMLGRAADEEYIGSHPEVTRFSDVPETHWAFYDIMEAYHAHDYHKVDGVERWVS